jgi:tetratricopeptide (TPR) repeat protein
MARRVADAKALYYALFSSVLIWEHSLEQKLADAAEMAKLEEESGRPEGADWGLIHLCHYHMEQGDIGAADADLEKLKKVAADLSHPLTVWRATLIEAMRALMVGQFEEAENFALEGFALGQKVNEENATQYLMALIYILRGLQGRLAEVEDIWRNALEEYPEVPAYRVANAFLHIALGREEEARTELDRLAARDFADLPKYFNMYITLSLLSEVAAAIGDVRRTALLYDLLLPYADRLLMLGIHNACLGAATLWLGMLAATLKRWDDAVAHFEGAIKTNARVGARPFFARSQHEYARMLIKRNAPGDGDKAKELLTEATVTYRELGMPTFLENAEELLTQL